MTTEPIQHIPRYLDNWLKKYQPALPATMIDGAKAVGKTQSARLFAQTELKLDQYTVRENLESNYGRLWDDTPPILLDEWQYLPEVWDRVRRMVDDHVAPGTFILAGSVQSKDLTLHSGAGRIVRVRMRPLSLAERIQSPPPITLKACLDGTVADRINYESSFSFKDYMHQITRSGFPELYQLDDEIRTLRLESYLENICSRNFKSQGLVIRQPGKMRSWMRAYAAATATTMSYTKILDAASAGEDDKLGKDSTAAYREALRSLWLIDDVECWYEGEDFFSRLKQSPKHYLADPALEAHLLNITAHDLIAGIQDDASSAQYGSIAGRLFESLCALSLQTYASSHNARIGYLRNQNGTREIDFIITKGQSIVAIEVKLSPVITDHDVRHLNWLEEKVGKRVKEKIVLTTGEKAYRRKDRVLVIPAALFG